MEDFPQYNCIDIEDKKQLWENRKYKEEYLTPVWFVLFLKKWQRNLKENVARRIDNSEV
jgi:hypothetical protein